ncbi:MAG: 23S rRNA (pseudouridine(1915)-N(3))-methyltransferase RlmH [Verrucomicrobia bacterium]|nr:23S rRNA (pseudouridine(1915)-N(3))-methyltransferase RlmH [Verrucomicrobiota bacterium]
MLKVKIYTIGRCKEKWLSEALSEYEKRLQGRAELEWHLAKDDAQLIDWTHADPNLIALDPKGDLFTSEAFSLKLLQAGSRLSFVIGGAEGIPPKILSQAKRRWSLSPLTFTHQIVRLVLAEQIYRALEIDRNTPYHK